MKTIIGNRYGRLTVVDKTDKKAHNREFIYICRCDCGNEIEVRTGLLTQGKTKSCGCLYEDTREKDLSALNAKRKHNGFRAKIVVNGKAYFGKNRPTKKEAYEDRLRLENELLKDIID